MDAKLVPFKVKQTIPQALRYTINSFNEQFPTDDACLAHIAEDKGFLRAEIAKCEKCGEDRKHHRVTKRTAYACDHCGNHIYPLAGTIFREEHYFVAPVVLRNVFDGVHPLRNFREAD